ncbi:hypothetical protein [Pseudomonas sp. VI4.1]|uniref:hypothetical protein n=1 Tax=Pseudomonas sp. VI4.1 TaxID=1941346 RepID=UPI002114D364|nr:hypothetical protein [Pseudomonas sp. VI4.1]
MRCDCIGQRDCIIAWRKGLRIAWLLENAKGGVEEQEVRMRHGFGDGEILLRATLDGADFANGR